jgi:RHS repeat-associated protein
MTWDFENRNTQVEQSVTNVVTFAFDGDSRRIQKVTSTTTQKFVYDGDNILLFADASNLTQAVYTIEPAEHGNLIAQRQLEGGVWVAIYHHFDLLGSTCDLTDSSAVITDSYTYFAYGDLVANSGTTVNPFQWVGMLGYWNDPEVSRTHTGEREVDSKTGRYISGDRVRPRPANLYPYARNDPINWTDPSGRDPASDTVARVRRHIEIDTEVAGALEQQLRKLDRVTADELVRRKEAGGKGVDPVPLAVGTPSEVENLVSQVDEIRRKKLDTLRDSLMNQVDAADGDPTIISAAEQIYSFAEQSLNKTPRIRFRYTNPYGDFVVEVDPRTARLLDYHGVYFEFNEKKGLTVADIRRQNPERRLALEDETGASPAVEVNDTLQPLLQGKAALEAAEDSVASRLGGALMVLEGGVEIATGVGLLFVPEPTFATKVLGTVAISHGTDNILTGVMILYTGEHHRMLTAQGISAVVSPLVSDETATVVGDLGDVAIGIVVTLGAGSARSSAMRPARASVAIESELVAPSNVLGAAIDRKSAHLSVVPSEKTLSRIERFAENKGIQYTFDPNISSPFTDAKTGVVTFRGTPGQTTLANVPIIDIMDEFAHAWGLRNPKMIGATAPRGAPYLRFHQQVYGRTSMLKTLTAKEAEALQWAEVQMLNQLKALNK